MSEEVTVTPQKGVPVEAFTANEFHSKVRFSLSDIHREIVVRLQGRLLTLVDATFSDPQQRKAFKDLVSNNIYRISNQFEDIAQQQERGMGSTGEEVE